MATRPAGSRAAEGEGGKRHAHSFVSGDHDNTRNEGDEEMEGDDGGDDDDDDFNDDNHSDSDDDNDENESNALLLSLL